MVDQDFITSFIDLFCIRKDNVLTQYVKNGCKQFLRQECNDSQFNNFIRLHLDGNLSAIGTYQVDNTTNSLFWGCYDFDENSLLQFTDIKLFKRWLSQKKGVYSVAENSAGGKYKIHLWIFCHECLTFNMRRFLEDLINEFLEIDTFKNSLLSLHEIFPKQDSVDIDKFGNFVKLPLGIHSITKIRSFFYYDNWEEIKFDVDVLTDLFINIQYNLNTIPEPTERTKAVTDSTTIINKNVNIPIINNNPIVNEFMNYCLNNELPTGSVNDVILKNMAVWFIKDDYTLEKLLLNIKPIFDNNGWVFDNLKGWFNTFFERKLAGENFNIHIGELVNFRKEHLPLQTDLLNFNNYGYPIKEFAQVCELVKNGYVEFEEINNFMLNNGWEKWNISDNKYREHTIKSVKLRLLNKGVVNGY